MSWAYLSWLVNLPSHVICAVVAVEALKLLRVWTVKGWMGGCAALRRCRDRFRHILNRRSASHE